MEGLNRVDKTIKYGVKRFPEVTMFIRKINKKRTKTYLGTFKPMRPSDDVFVKSARALVRGINKGLPKTAGYRFRISMTPKKPLKEFAWKYNNKHSPRKVRIEDAATVDVYVHKVIHGR